MFGYGNRIKDLEDQVKQMNYSLQKLNTRVYDLEWKEKYPPKYKKGDIIDGKWRVAEIEFHGAQSASMYYHDPYWLYKCFNCKTKELQDFTNLN